MAKKRVMSLNTLKEKRFDVMRFEGQWLQWFGEPERNVKFLFYGPSGSGKSTFVLRLCDYLAQWGKVAYNSWEEGIAKTFQDRVESNQVQNLDKIFLLDSYTFEEMMNDSFKRRNYRTIVLDSTNFMGLTQAQYADLVAKYPSKIFVFISQVNGRGRVKGGTDILHGVDIKVRCDGGIAEIRSRFAPEKTVVIFEKKQPTAAQLQLKYEINN